MKSKKALHLMLVLTAVSAFSFDLDSYKDFAEKNKSLEAGQLIDKVKPEQPYFSEIGAEKRFLYLDTIKLKYGLSSSELEMLKKNNFVVTERKSFNTFGHALRDIFNKDLPVFLTTDAVLYTLHLSYDAILVDVEKRVFEPAIKKIISQMRMKYQDLKTKYASSDVEKNLEDVDLYLAIAESMIEGKKVSPAVVSTDKFDNVYNAIQDECLVEMQLFSEGARQIDFSQFTVRGHYVREELENYFKTMIWLGRTELLITSPKQGEVELVSREDTRRMTIDAILLSELLVLSGQKNVFDEMDKLLSFFIGESDNLTVDEFFAALEECSITSAEMMLNDSAFNGLTRKLSATPEAGQKILSQVIMTNVAIEDTLELPVSYLFFGQRFIVDSYVFGNVVYDKIFQNGSKVLRMMPDPLDVMYTLGNDDAVPLLESELKKYFYTPELEKMRYLLDSYDESFWRGTIYNSWLNILKKLNPSAYPEVGKQPLFMRSSAWHQEKLNTQLASWAQLRHDNVLYAKQSYTPGTECSFPHAYVEPYPAFYEEVARMARTASKKLAEMQSISGISSYYKRVAELMDTLKVLAEKELAKEKFTKSDSAFMAGMLVVQEMCGAPVTSGWYGDLIYNNTLAERNDYTIADVHTQPTDENGDMVGHVLHAGVGKINLGVFLAESPSAEYQQMAFAGPVVSYYQKVTSNFKRLTDEEWTTIIEDDSVLSRPDWVNCFLADNSGEKLPDGRLLEGIKYAMSVLPYTKKDELQSFSAKAHKNAIAIILPTVSDVQISLHDLRGKSLFKVNRSFSAGVHTISFPAASGVYIAVVKSNGRKLSLPVGRVMK